MYFIWKYCGIQLFYLISRSNVVLESLKWSIGRAFLLQLFEGKTRLHAKHAARSPARVRPLMGQSETFLFFFAKTSQRQSCFRVPQSSFLPWRALGSRLGLCHPWRMREPMKPNVKTSARLFQVLSEILEGSLYLFKSRPSFDSEVLY